MREATWFFESVYLLVLIACLALFVLWFIVNSQRKKQPDNIKTWKKYIALDLILLVLIVLRIVLWIWVDTQIWNSILTITAAVCWGMLTFDDIKAYKKRFK